MPQRATDERSRWPESLFTFPESVFNLPGIRVHLRPESVFKIVRNPQLSAGVPPAVRWRRSDRCSIWGEGSYAARRGAARVSRDARLVLLEPGDSAWGRPRVRFGGGSRGGNEALEFVEPVLDDVHVCGGCRSIWRFALQQLRAHGNREEATVSCNAVALNREGRAARPPHKQYARTPSHEVGLGRDVYSRDSIPAAGFGGRCSVDELTPIRRPRGLYCSLGGDLMSASWPWVWLHVDLPAARLIRHIGKPAPIRRKLWVAFIER